MTCYTHQKPFERTSKCFIVSSSNLFPPPCSNGSILPRPLGEGKANRYGVPRPLIAHPDLRGRKGRQEPLNVEDWRPGQDQRFISLGTLLQ